MIKSKNCGQSKNCGPKCSPQFLFCPQFLLRPQFLNGPQIWLSRQNTEARSYYSQRKEISEHSFTKDFEQWLWSWRWRRAETWSKAVLGAWISSHKSWKPDLSQYTELLFLLDIQSDFQYYGLARFADTFSYVLVSFVTKVTEQKKLEFLTSAK